MLFISTNTPNTLNAQRDLYMMNADGKGRKILASDVEVPDWGMK